MPLQHAAVASDDLTLADCNASLFIDATATTSDEVQLELRRRL